MRPMWLFLVGIAAWGCRDKPTERARTEPTPVAPVAPAAPQNAAAAPSAPPPSLEAAARFEAEARDAAWAGATEQAIHAVAPQLTDVTCRRAQCRVTLSAATEQALVGAVDALQAEDSLRSIDGVEQILLTRAVEQGGSHAMQIYVRFERAEQ